jgi:hypothetical protein
MKSEEEVRIKLKALKSKVDESYSEVSHLMMQGSISSLEWVLEEDE